MTRTTTSNELYAAADAAFFRGPDAGNETLYHQRNEEALDVRAADLAAEADEDDLTPEELARGYEDAIALGEAAQRMTDLASRYRAPE